jgi:hypothetical protein
MADTGHFEFRSPHEPPRRIPISETGYRSHFAPMDDVEASTSPQEYMRAIFWRCSRIATHCSANNFPNITPTSSGASGFAGRALLAALTEPRRSRTGCRVSAFGNIERLAGGSRSRVPAGLA